MSVEPQALERSVLERKERDELAAIAEAMGVKAGARTSKANLIGQILREAGIETEEDKPKRASKAKAENGAKTSDDSPSEEGKVDEQSEATPSDSAESTETSERSDEIEDTEAAEAKTDAP